MKFMIAPYSSGMAENSKIHAESAGDPIWCTRSLQALIGLTKLTDLKGGGSLSTLGRGESGGRSGEKGGDSKLHLDVVVSSRETQTKCVWRMMYAATSLPRTFHVLERSIGSTFGYFKVTISVLSFKSRR